MNRPVLLQPDTTQAAGQLGAPCPALKMEVACGDRPCPVDCVMSQWSSWGRCSRDCGGGMQRKSREVLTIGNFGGKMCGVTDQSRECNVQSCDRDCVLGEWSPWGPCSEQCMWSWNATKGQKRRVRRVRVPATGEGSCPAEHTRMEVTECNTHLCPAEAKCSTDGDIVLVLDGSGSVQGPQPDAPPKDWKPGAKDPANFQALKAFANGFVARAVLSKETADPSSMGVRIGAVIMADKPVIAATVTGDRGTLGGELLNAPWPAGETNVVRALQASRELLDLATSDRPRPETIVLVTDGRRNQAETAAVLAKQLRDAGVRILVVLVQQREKKRYGAEARERSRDFICSIAGAPCSDNVVQLDDWSELVPQLSRIVAAACPLPGKK